MFLKTSFKKLCILTLLFSITGIFYGCSSDKKDKIIYEKYAITSKNNSEKISLKLEEANTNEKRLKGLMNRKSLNKNTGMIFDFVEPGYYSMWMKNTYIPLDMIFLNKEMEITGFALNRTPLKEDIINPCEALYETSVELNKKVDTNAFFEECEAKFMLPQNLTRYVVELPAGTIKEANIEIGDILLKK